MSTHPVLLTCHHCGAMFRRPVLGPGECARCLRCHSVLESYAAFSPDAWVAVVIGAMITFIIANAYPVATLFVQGTGQAATFMNAVIVTWHTGYPEVAAMTFAAGFMLPVVHLCLLLWVLGPLALGRLPLAFQGTVRWIDRLKPWCMVPVFLMGVLVAVVKLSGVASLKPGVGLFATAAAAVLLTALGKLDSSKIRRMAHDLGLQPPRALLAKPPSPALLSRTWALLSAAVILYIPANLMPVMKVNSISGPSAHTIMGGVIELWQMGSWDIALVVFIASVFVPMVKMLTLGSLVWLTQKKSKNQLRARTHLYEMVELIGQWSMLDVFVVILLSALARFGSLLNIEPGLGAAAFGGVVILTMLAAMGFDPRLAWRRAGHRRHLSGVAQEFEH